jgi:Asp-tRNA(Asn)/Glu-tRNA(Gln) amidotransferase A subunit family amidase
VPGDCHAGAAAHADRRDLGAPDDRERQEIPYNDMLFWPGLTCGFHLPASVAPIGVSKAGLPIGVQIVGPLYGDRTTIQVAGCWRRRGRDSCRRRDGRSPTLACVGRMTANRSDDDPPGRL